MIHYTKLDHYKVKQNDINYIQYMSVKLDRIDKQVMTARLICSHGTVHGTVKINVIHNDFGNSRVIQI